MLEFKKINELDSLYNKYKKLCRIFSILRLIMAICLIIMLVCLLSLKDYLVYGVLTGISFICFILIVGLSSPYYRKLNLLDCKKKVYLRHNQRREKNFSHFADNGNEFKTIDDYKLSDLDIFGAKSLYQYLSEAKTPLGRKLLARQLSNPVKMDDRFTALVDNLANNEASLDIEAILHDFNKKSNLSQSNEFTSAVSDKIAFKFTYILPIISFLVMIVYICLMIPLGWNLYVPLGFLFLNLILAKLLINDPILAKDAYTYYYLSDLYYEMSIAIKNTDIDNDYYKELKANIVNDIPTLKAIKSTYSLLKLRRSVIINIILNLFFSIDSFIMIILKLKIKNGLALDKSLESLGILEVALSLKNIGMDNEYSCIPDDNDKIEATGIYHPFVKNCIANDITFNGGILLTGSNMSGKTTFMRTLGICILLKNAGSIVPAAKFSSPKLNIYTSLRANDMLQEGVSTFYAEIKRMKMINTKIKEEKCLILVDEIFKGTNAKERISASISVIEKLNKYNAFFIVSTHDHELCEADGIINYHFEEMYNNDEISFDYKLKSGSGTKGNALYLLKMSGIIE